MPRVDDLKEMEDELERLIALSSYKRESQVLKDSLRELRSSYRADKSLQEIRKGIDEKLGEKSLGELVTEMRGEEEH